MKIPRSSLKWVFFSCCLGLFIAAWGLQSMWLPKAKIWAAKQLVASGAATEEGDDHAGHDHGGHDHAGHDESSSLELSPQARKNIGLSKENVRPVKLETYMRTISVPAVVVERPGQTRIKIVATMTGIITNVNIILGEAILPERELFSLRLTHEDMVQAQASYLKTLGDLDVEEKEIKRLMKVTNNGAIAGKLLLERQYAKQKLVVDLDSQREALYLHGFSKKQVNQIATTRKLLSHHQIYAPSLSSESGDISFSNSIIRRTSATSQPRALLEQANIPKVLIVQELAVNKGDFVAAGDTLCVLADFRSLYIQGRAFEHDAEELAVANNNQWDVEAVLEDRAKHKTVIGGLKIAYLNNQVESDSRAFNFFVNLPNKVIGDAKESHGHRYITWQFKPGQRMQIRVPVEKIEKQIVLPVDAVASAGAERYVFQENGDHFDRIPVHVIYQDQIWAVIENDGSIFPGDIVAFTGAHQMQMALNNKAGGAVDPHAGHNH